MKATKDRLLTAINTVITLETYSPADIIYSEKYNISPTDMVYILLKLEKDFNFKITDDFVDAMDVYVSVLNSAGNAMRTTWTEDGRDFRLEITTYTPSERDTMRERLRVQLMAGESYDMFFWDELPLWINASSGFFADVNQLIDQDPNTYREDFYTNILDAWEVDGGLYSFPLSFEFIYIGINANLPASVLDRFTQHTAITISEMMQIYIYLQQEYYDEFGHLNTGIFLPHTLPIIIANFVNFETRTSYLDNGNFALLLDDYKLVLDMWTQHAPESIGVLYRPLMELLARRNVFMSATNVMVGGIGQPAFMSMLFESPTPSFVHFIPLSDDSGRLILEQRISISYSPEDMRYRIHPSWGSLNISATGNSILAWEFTQHLISAFSSHSEANMIVGDPHRDRPDLSNFLRHTLDTLTTPIKRSYTTDYIVSAFEQGYSTYSTHKQRG